MPTYDACLIDVFDTVLTLDRREHAAALAAAAGVPVAAFSEAAGGWGAKISDGRAPLAEAIRAILGACGPEPSVARVDELLVEDRRIQLDLVVVHPDSAPFLESLRARGVRTAFVSNCAENTRPLLEATGLAGLVDELVLSCEVGVQKPEPRIFHVALDRLGATAERAILIDDRRDYCDAAAALGLGTIRIDRYAGAGDVASLAEVGDLTA